MSKIKNSELWDQLLAQVNEAGILPQGVHLSQVEPLLDFDDLIDEYKELKKEPEFDIEAFVDSYFDIQLGNPSSEEE